MEDIKAQVEKHNAQPLYEASKSGKVFKRSVMRLNDNGTASTSMGFAVCEVPEFVEPRFETAQLIARLLNEYEETQNDK